MAAAQNAFRSALQRIGLNPNTRDAIVDNGFLTILDLVTVQEEDLDKLPNTLRRGETVRQLPSIK
jgi:deoxycytidine triphosphate deaminase